MLWPGGFGDGVWGSLWAKLSLFFFLGGVASPPEVECPDNNSSSDIPFFVMVSGGSALALRTRVILIVACKNGWGPYSGAPFCPYGSFWSVPLGAVSKFGVLGLKRTRFEFNILNFFLSLCGAADAPALY